MTKEFVRIV